MTARESPSSLTNACSVHARVGSENEVNRMLKLYAFSQALANSLRKREQGQTMAEYGVVLAVITLAVIAAITLLAGNVSNALNAVAGVLP